MRHPLPALLSLGLWTALLAPPVPAQGPVCVTGRVVPVGPTICQQGETHMLECARVFLRSSSVNLARYNGQIVRIEGRDIGLLCTVLDVNRVTPAPATLIRCGSPSPGCPIKLKVCPGAIGRWWLFGSFRPGFRPVDCQGMRFFADGSLLLGVPGVTLVSGMPLGTCGELTINIPADPALTGLQAWFQGVRQDIGPVGPLQLTNAECVTLLPMRPCSVPNC